MDVAFESSNNIRFLISCQTNSSHNKTIKLITNRSIYDLKFLKYEGRIADIIKMDDEKRYSFNMDIKSSNLRRSLPLIQSRKLNRNHDWHKSVECSKGQNMVIAKEKMGKMIHSQQHGKENFQNALIPMQLGTQGQF